MSKKNTSKTQTLRLPLTGADHRAIALLRLMAGEGACDWGQEAFSPYVAAARTLVQSKHAFTGSLEALTVEGYVLKSECFTARAEGTDEDKARQRVIATIIEGNEGTTVTADAWDLLAFTHAIITEAQMYGAAVMFELLEGGAR